MLFLAESPVGPPLWLTTALAFAAVLLAAILATMFHHWQWLRERRLAEYADLLTAFRAVTSASATAIGGSAVYDTGDPDQYRVLQELVVAARDKGEQFLAAKDRVELVLTPGVVPAINKLTRFMYHLRDVMRPLDPGKFAEVEPATFEVISAEAFELAAAFKRAAKLDVGALPARSLLWRWLSSPFRRTNPAREG